MDIAVDCWQTVLLTEKHLCTDAPVSDCTPQFLIHTSPYYTTQCNSVYFFHHCLLLKLWLLLLYGAWEVTWTNKNALKNNLKDFKTHHVKLSSILSVICVSSCSSAFSTLSGRCALGHSSTLFPTLPPLCWIHIPLISTNRVQKRLDTQKA